MRAIGAHSMCLVTHFCKQNFPILNALYLKFPLFPALQIEARKTLDLVLLCHDSGCIGKLSDTDPWQLT